jgi:hypothetical protein
MSGAGEELQAAAMSALGEVPGLGVFCLAPVQAAFPYATVDAGLESDWGHKSGRGREVRLAVTIRDEGERPGRVQRLTNEVEAAIEAGAGETPSWSIVSMRFLRRQLVREQRRGWAAVIEYRARMLQL